MPKHILVCKACNETFISGYKKKYCSVKCRNWYNNKILKANMKESECVSCGKLFEQKKSSNRAYCSKECQEGVRSKEHRENIKIDPKWLTRGKISGKTGVSTILNGE